MNNTSLPAPARSNSFPGTCNGCKAAVPANAGTISKVGGAWRVACARCSGAALAPVLAAAAAPASVRASLSGGDVMLAPTGYLGGDKFEAYRAACAGCTYDAAARAQVCAAGKASAVLARLVAAGFALEIGEGVEAAVAGAQRASAELVSAAVARTGKVGARLAARGKSLFPFQASGTAWLAARTGALLSDEMGLGKTIQALAALPEGACAVVVCPAVAKGVWKREAAAWRPDLRVSVLSGRGSFRWPSAGEIVVINYDILPTATAEGYAAKLPETIEAACPAGCVVIADEAHAVKSVKARRTVNFRALSECVRARGGKAWGITATPLLNRASELWALLQSLGIAREAFGSWSAFTDLMGGYQGAYGYQWGEVRNPREVGERLARVMLRRLRTEVLPELPVKTYSEVSVELDAKTAKLCDKALKSLAARGLDLHTLDALVQDTAEDGASFETVSQARAALSTAKLKAAIELVESYEEQGEPVVLFSAYRATVDTIGAREGWATITGDTAPEERTRIEEAFQAGKLKGVAGTIKAAGVAITLTRAAHAIFIDREWTPALNSQAEDRICRIGQTRGCVITSLVGDHAVDQRVHELLMQKAEVIATSVEQAVRGENVDAGVAEAFDFEAATALARSHAALADARTAEAAKRAEVLASASDEARAAATLQRQQEGRERAISRGWSAEEGDVTRRGPEGAQEIWAADALAILSGNDDDHASIKNNVGWNKPDSAAGHWLCIEVASGLTPSQWHLAVQMCRKYAGQVGACPKG